MADAGPDPAIVVIDGGVYLSLLPRRLLAHLLLRPAAWWQRQAWRLAPGGPLARVAASVEDAAVRLRDAARTAEPVEGNARAAWARCRRTLDLVTQRLAPDFLDAGLVASAVRGEDDPLGQADPVLRALGRGPDGVQEIAERLPYRSVREWALEHSRLGEAAAGRSGMARAFAARDACFPQERSARGRSGRLLALARDNLSFGVALLRMDLAAVEAALGLPVGAVHRYDWPTIGTAAETGRAPAPTDPPVRPDPCLPSRFTLGHLERWVAGDRDAAPGSALGFWVSGRGPIEGRVVDRDVPGAPPGETPIRVVVHPDVREMASMPEGGVVVALAGNRLSHAAQVLRDRGIPALFGAEAFRTVVQPGRRVRLEPDGRIVGRDEEEIR
jgi:hypothetical protein